MIEVKIYFKLKTEMLINLSTVLGNFLTASSGILVGLGLHPCISEAILRRSATIPERTCSTYPHATTCGIIIFWSRLFWLYDCGKPISKLKIEIWKLFCKKQQSKWQTHRQMTSQEGKESASLCEHTASAVFSLQRAYKEEDKTERK